MPFPLQLILAAIGSALLGSIPFSLLIGRFVGGIDLRQHGSGNVGATNVARTLGPRWGLVALLLDAAKGITPVLLFPWLLTGGSPGLVNERVLCGVCAILGHMFPPWLGFRGGKGVATALGVVSVLAPAATGCAFLAFALTFAVSRIVSLSSILAALTFAIAEILIQQGELISAQAWGLGLFTIAIPLLILIRHHTNIVRLWKREEPQLQLKKTPPRDAA